MRPNEDLYLNFGGMTDDNQRAVIQAYVFPLVSWIWIGTLVLIFGTLICLVPSKVKTAVRPHGSGGVYEEKCNGSEVVCWLLMVAVAALAQTASEKPSVDVRRVGARLQCQCGCKDSVATCSMLECHFSKPAKERIAQMQSGGHDATTQIVQAFIRDYGTAIYLAPPNAFGWIVPYASVGLGLVVILVFLRKYRKPQRDDRSRADRDRRSGAGEVQRADREGSPRTWIRGAEACL